LADPGSCELAYLRADELGNYTGCAVHIISKTTAKSQWASTGLFVAMEQPVNALGDEPVLKTLYGYVEAKPQSDQEYQNFAHTALPLLPSIILPSRFNL
jgi:hypothetical protein